MKISVKDSRDDDDDREENYQQIAELPFIQKEMFDQLMLSSDIDNDQAYPQFMDCQIVEFKFEEEDDYDEYYQNDTVSINQNGYQLQEGSNASV